MNKCIVILSYNHPEITSKTIDSCLPFNIKIILIHNGSEQKNITKLKERFPQIEHFEIKVNRGFTGGVNDGLEFAFNNFEWVYFLTNDTELIELPNELLESGFYAPLIYFRKLGRIDSIGGGFVPATGKLRHLKTDSFNKNLFERFYIPGTAFLIHRDIFIKTGKFDEVLNTYWEDVDFSMRAQKLNLKLGACKEFKLLHKVGKTCHDNPLYTTYYYQRNRKKVSWRYANLFERFSLFFILAFDFIKGSLRFYQKGDKKRLLLIKQAFFD